MRGNLAGFLVLALAACGGGAARGPGGVDPADQPPAGSADPTPIAPPAEAFARGWMPLESTGVPFFRAAHPGYDGRGVLVAILDSGIDPAVPGLGQTSVGTPKLVDIRDFSGEGRIPLREVRPGDDSVVVAGRKLAGAGRLRAHATGPIYAGALFELPLGRLPAADLNGNGVVGDTLPVLVTRATDSWILFADTDGDGTLANERPIRPYRVARETFGWSTGNRPIPVNLAVIMEDGDPPVLDLFFDTSGHGTHVAGIAAGHALYGVRDFEGVAPGAELLGIKIANDAKGGITVTGSILEAAAYAIRVARERQMPLVLNLSFGVGNEREGAARIDHTLDSLLAANPDVVMTVSAGNDGPGLSTIGFPGSAERVISVGATHPGVFLPPSPDRGRLPDLVAFFSARGGEVLRPDLVAPGLAYSTVPRWNTGEEVKEGTSMAAPHVAGLVASLLSGLASRGLSATAAEIERALVATARRLPGTMLDQGAGQPDLLSAWRRLTSAIAAVPKVVSVEGSAGDAGWIVDPSGSGELRRSFQVRADSGAAGVYRLSSDVPWILPPPTVALPAGETGIPLAYLPDRLPEPGAYVGTVTATRSDSAAVFHLVSTLIRPHAARPDSLPLGPPPGRAERVFVRADSGRALRVELEDRAGAPYLVFVHEPGGMPYRGGAAAVVGAEDPHAAFLIDARDVVPGLYEVVAIAGPLRRADGWLRLLPSPVRAVSTLAGDSIRTRLRNASGEAFDGVVEVELAGAERAIAVAATGSQALRFSFPVPEWAAEIRAELALEREDWPRFTDFGLTLQEPSGRILAISPLNYAVGRVELTADSTDARELEVVLDPGFADPGARERWSGMLRIRLLARDPIPAGSAPLRLALDAGADLVVQLPRGWDPLPSGFTPVARTRIIEGDRVWTAETHLSAPLPPIMR